jgi:hypothetical protein
MRQHGPGSSPRGPGINVGGIAVQFTPGETYEDEPVAAEQETEQERAKRRAERRIEAVEGFRKTAQASTCAQMEPLVGQLFAMCIQLRALGGTGTQTNLPQKLREAADFLEDL